MDADTLRKLLPWRWHIWGGSNGRPPEQQQQQQNDVLRRLHEVCMDLKREAEEARRD